MPGGRGGGTPRPRRSRSERTARRSRRTRALFSGSMFAGHGPVPHEPMSSQYSQLPTVASAQSGSAMPQPQSQASIASREFLRRLLLRVRPLETYRGDGNPRVTHVLRFPICPRGRKHAHAAEEIVHLHGLRHVLIETSAESRLLILAAGESGDRDGERPMASALFVITYRTNQNVSILTGHADVTYDQIRWLGVVGFQRLAYRSDGAHSRAMVLKHDLERVPRVRIIFHQQHIECSECAVVHVRLGGSRPE